MKLICVPRFPPFRYRCECCNNQWTTMEKDAYANLHGKPFQAYYCSTCLDKGLVGTSEEYEEMLKTKIKGDQNDNR